MPTHDVLIIGAGAAGMMAAGVAGQRGKRVLLLDHAARLAEKIRISGGGRCNFTNRSVTPQNYLCGNPHFVRSALSRYSNRDFIALVDAHGLPYHERELGQLFCDDSAGRIIDLLKKECDQGQVQWCRPCQIHGIQRADHGEAGALFSVNTDRGVFRAPKLVLATGGLAVPKIGSTPFGYQIAQQFGLKVIAPKPALVPLTFAPDWQQRYGDLSGVTLLDAETACGNGRFREAILFTHKGLSGPAILQISSYWQEQDSREPIHINLLPDLNLLEWLMARRRSKVLIATALAELLPKRFVQRLCDEHDWHTALDQTPNRTLEAIARHLHDWQIHPAGTLGHAKAEATLGGVDTNALSSKTMEAKNVPGLYFAGEVMDVTGHLGGYNFQWAWSSGHAVGMAV